MLPSNSDINQLLLIYAAAATRTTSAVTRSRLSSALTDAVPDRDAHSAALTGTASAVPDQDAMRRSKEPAEYCLNQHREHSVHK